ncbi:aldehyde reductase [Capsulimonas corticalis]|uniref:Aldehyde reductase n=1 Tax=Capsulimonas corticalis TaxID=2219043 RepID=A0A402CQR4_9BACT|nr:aldo/keto reductase [Capsulimonas corticalis]BDI34365.1 aldehyde reductase [Capsulimonas corticalis]
MTDAKLAEGVDPARVPKKTLATGAQIPAIGLGTFGSDNYTSDQIARAVVDAASVGYRHFDCASVYGNEHLIGPALREITHSGVAREDLWVTSKVWNDRHDDVIASCEQSLRDLKLDYLDLYLVHWPFPNAHAPGVDVSSRDAHARPYIHDDYMKTWARMETLAARGLVRHIGTSNMTIPKLELVLRDASLKPAANEMELHPHFQQPELFQYVLDRGIVPIGYSPIGSPSRPARDRTPDDTVDVEDPVILSIAERLGVHPAVVCVKWAAQRGQIPIPFSVKRSQYLATLQAVVGEPLTDAEMAAIAGIDKNNRLIKGQVFLWKENQSWEDLWDIHGEIAQ